MAAQHPMASQSMISPELQSTAQHAQQAVQNVDHQLHTPTSHDGGPPKKRARYTPVACNDCKRRKVKCNGQIPCERCHKLQIQCEYAPNYNIRDPYLRSMQEAIQALEQQVHELNLRLHQAGVPHLQSPPAFHLPTQNASSAQPLDPSIQDSSMSFSRQGPDESSYQLSQAAESPYPPPASAARDGDSSLMPSAPYAPMFSPTTPQTPAQPRMHEQKDPIWSMDLNEVAHLIRALPTIDPPLAACLDLDEILASTLELFAFVDGVKRSGLMKTDKPGADALKGIHVDLMKMAVALALFQSAPDRLAEARHLAADVRTKLGNHLFETGDARSVALFLLVAVMTVRDSGDVAGAQRALNVASNTMSEIKLNAATIHSFPVNQAKKTQLTNLANYVHKFQNEQLGGNGGKPSAEVGGM